MRILRDKQVADKIGGSRATVWRKAKTEPDFPKPLKISAGITGWLESEVEAYLEQRIAAAREARRSA